MKMVLDGIDLADISFN